MEHLAPPPSQTRQAIFFPLPPVSSRLRATLLLLIGLIGINLGAMVIGQLLPPPANPFTPYASVFSGRGRAELETIGFVCGGYHASTSSDASRIACTLYPESEDFASITAIVSEADVIERVTFVTASNTLTYGDLTNLLRGQRFLAYHERIFYFSPARDTYRVVRRPHRVLSFFSPVQLVTFAPDGIVEAQ